jgi:protein-S-isoprenylcysteine O-methyltransferase Ste14
MLRIFDGVEGKILKARIYDAFKYWVYIPAAVVAGGKLADLMLELPPIPRHFLLTLAGMLLVFSGAVLIQRSTKDLAVYGDGTPNPLRPPKRLVSEGSYGLCRHPMFFGYTWKDRDLYCHTESADQRRKGDMR